MNTTATHYHRFERAGLGVAPFRCVGMHQNWYSPCPGVPAQPGGTCAYCGTGIANEFLIRSADGKEFVVGSECVRRTDDTGLKKNVDEQLRSLARAQRAARNRERLAELDTLLADPRVIEHAANQPHPMAWRAAQGDTLRDWAVWMRFHAGHSGCWRVLKCLRSLQGVPA